MQKVPVTVWRLCCLLRQHLLLWIRQSKISTFVLQVQLHSPWGSWFLWSSHSRPPFCRRTHFQPCALSMCCRRRRFGQICTYLSGSYSQSSLRFRDPSVTVKTFLLLITDGSEGLERQHGNFARLHIWWDCTVKMELSSFITSMWTNNLVCLWQFEACQILYRLPRYVRTERVWLHWSGSTRLALLVWFCWFRSASPVPLVWLHKIEWKTKSTSHQCTSKEHTALDRPVWKI